MNDNSFEAVFVAVCFFAALALTGGFVLWDALTAPAPTEEDRWVLSQSARCQAMNSNLDYDRKTRTAECWRTPFMRMPQLMFETKYAGQ